MGYSRTDAAIAGTRQIFVAILGCTATLIFAFLPLLALPGTPGKFIGVLPTAVVATIIGSLLIALFIIPFLASRVLKDGKDQHESRLLKSVMGVIHRYYRPALHYALARPRATVGVAIGGSLLLSVLLVPLIGSSLFPKADTPQFLIHAEGPNGTSLAQTDATMRFIESKLAARPEVKSWFANIEARQSADLLQPYRAQQLGELRRSVPCNSRSTTRAARRACSTSCAASFPATRMRAST